MADQPPAKKQRQSLLDRLVKFRCELPIKTAVSPGSWQCSRVAVQTPADPTSSTQSYFATGPDVFAVRCHLPEDDGRVTGLDGISLPAPAGEPVAAQRLEGLSLGAEVQSITLAEREQGGGPALLAAIDAFGSARLLRLSEDGEPGNHLSLASSHANTEAGWAGMSVLYDESDPLVATACAWPRCLTFFSGGRELLSLGCLHQPAALAFLAGSSRGLLALAEGSQVSLWDARAANSRSATARLSPGAGSSLPLLCVAGDCSGHFLAAGGAESTAVLFDLRRPGLPVARWPSCLKHEVTAVAFPAARSDFLFVGGADQEVRCGAVAPGRSAGASMANPNHSSRPAQGEGVSIRGDSRWLGLARAPGADLLAGWAASQHLFLSRFAFPAAA